jgi:pyruvate dehydrogenase (quinone)
MAQTVSDQIVQRLLSWGVRRLYGYPGDGINGVFGALQRVQDKLPFVQARHEEMAAFMACAHAKFTGEPGVCIATSGPGAIHLLNGLYDAKLDHQPVVAIVGQAATSAMGGMYQQEVDLPDLFKDVASEYVATVTDPRQVRHAVDRAFRTAITERTVTCVILPKNVQELDAAKVPHAHDTLHSSIAHATPRVIPREADLKKAAEILNAGQRVAMLVGQGALGATDEVIEVADLLGAGVAKALLGKAVLADDLRSVTGAIGLLGTKPSWDLMQECDTLLMVGTNFPYAEFLPKEGQARGIQIDIDGRLLGLRYPTELNLIGDSLETLQALIPLLKRKSERAWRQRIEAGIAEWWKIMEARAMNDAKPLNPQRVFHELSPRLPDNCIVTSDSGSSANWFARDLKIRRGMMASLSGTLATMGCGVPYSIGAKFAFPERCVLALVGDGAMQMNGINELITVAKYWRQWSDPRFIVLVLNNHDLNQVTWEMRAMEGDPKFEASQDVPEFGYARYAESLGLKGIRVDNPAAVGPAWDEALSANKPVVYEAVTDPEVPPLPPHITIKQAKAMAEALIKGDPGFADIIRQTWRDVIDGLLPRGRSG